MSDYLVDLGANRTARNLVRTLGLPLPLPQKLERGKGPLSARPVEGKTVWVGLVGAADATVQAALAASIPALGASVALLGPGFDPQPWNEAGEGFGRPVDRKDLPADDDKGHALVFDATGARTVADLKALYNLGHNSVRKLARCARIVVVGRPPESMGTPAEVAVQRSLTGFAKALAKELGAKGITSNVLEVAVGAEDRLGGPLAFLLSKRSAFVTGQTLAVDARVDGTPGAWSARPLDGKVALVTGAARGIGKATAKRLAEEGAKVLVLDRPADAGPLGEVARSVGGVAVAADITDDGAAAAILEAAGEGGLDIVVHNASTLGPTPLPRLDEIDDEDFEQVFQVGVLGPQRLTRSIIGNMALRGEGTVISISSDAAVEAYPRWGAYSAAKAAQDHLMRIWASECEREGLRFLSIDPGEMDTEMHAAALPDADPSTLARPQLVAERIATLVEDSAPASGSRVRAQELVL